MGVSDSVATQASFWFSFAVTILFLPSSLFRMYQAFVWAIDRYRRRHNDAEQRPPSPDTVDLMVERARLQEQVEGLQRALNKAEADLESVKADTKIRIYEAKNEAKIAAEKAEKAAEKAEQALANGEKDAEEAAEVAKAELAAERLRGDAAYERERNRGEAQTRLERERGEIRAMNEKIQCMSKAREARDARRVVSG